MTPAAFYCVSSELYLPGAVALINSLRLVGHEEPIYLVDCGIDPAHRELLEPHVELIEAPPDVAPYLLKTLAPLERPSEAMVLIDVDMIVTRPLGPLIQRARTGTAVAVKDRLDRFVPEWGDQLGLGDIDPVPYVSSGFVCLGGASAHDVLELWDRGMAGVDFERSYLARDDPAYPFRYLDQDVLNAVLAARLGPSGVEVLDPELAPTEPFHGVRVRNERTLTVTRRNGRDPLLLHHFIRKPWLEPVYHSPYSRLLARLLLGDDVAVRLPEDEVPLRLRGGLVARLERARVNALDLGRWVVRDVIPERLGARRPHA